MLLLIEYNFIELQRSENTFCTQRVKFKLAEMATAKTDCKHFLFEAVNTKSISKFQFVKKTFYEFYLLDCFNDRNENGRSLLGMALNSKSDTLIDKVLKFLSDNCDNNDIDFAGELWKVKAEQIINFLADANPLTVELMEVMVFNHNHDLRSSRWLEFVVKVFTRSTYFNRLDKIIALELISAVLIFKDPSSLLGLRSYREAMRLRYPQSACEQTTEPVNI